MIHIPDKDTQMIGVYTAGDALAKALIQQCTDEDSMFKFVTYDEATKLEKDVIAGRLAGGCVFDADFSTHVANGRLKNQITCLTPPGSSQILALQETLYAAFFELYSPQFLTEKSSELFSTDSRILIENFKQYMQQDALFRITYETVDATMDLDTDSAKNDISYKGGAVHHSDVSVYPLQGMAGLLLFVMAWMCIGRKLEKTSMGLYGVLDSKNKSVYMILQILAELTVPAICMLVMISCFGQYSRGIFRESIGMIMFVCICCLWVEIIGQFINTSTAWSGLVLTLCVIQVVLCPVFINLSSYFPAAKYLKYLFPLGWYV